MTKKNIVIETLGNIPFVALFCAKPNSGKSFKTKAIVQTYLAEKLISEVYAFSATAITGDYSWVPDGQVSTQFTKDEYDALKEYQNKRRDSKTKKCPGIAIIIDDMVGAIDWKSGWVTNFIATHRHYGFYVFVLTQYLKSVPPAVRKNVGYVFVWPQVDDLGYKIILDDYFGNRFFPGMSKQDKIQLIEEATSDPATKPCILVRVNEIKKEGRFKIFWIP